MRATATRAARDGAQRLGHLQALAVAVQRAADAAAVAQSLLTQGLPAVDATWGVVAALGTEDGALHVLGHVGVRDATVPVDTITLDAPQALTAAVRRRAPVWTPARHASADAPDVAPFDRAAPGPSVALPLLIGEQVIGGLELGFAAAHSARSADEASLTTLAALGAGALERARLAAAERRLQDEASRYHALEAITDTALSHLSQADLLHTLLVRLTAILAADNAAILLLEDDATHLCVHLAYGPEEAVAGRVRVPLGQGVAGRIAATRAPLVVDDLAAAAPTNPVLRTELASLMGVPLLVGDRLIGVVHVDSATPRHFTLDELHLLQHAAERIAVVLDRTRLYAVLEERERRFRATFEQAAVGIAHVSIAGAWLRVNQKLCAIVGFSREELLATTFQEITHPDDLDTDLAHVRQLLAGERESYAMDKRYLCKDGSMVWIHLTVSLVRQPDGAPDYFISVVEDIAARKAAEEEVRQLAATLEQRVAERTTRLQEANAALEAFSYSVSHDLRAPLRAMQGFAAALSEDYAAVLDADGQEYARQIIRAAERMDTLIADLLAYSRLGRAELALRPVALDAVVAEAQAQVGGAIRAAGAEIAVSPDLPRVQGHQPTLVQVVANLLTNAVTFVAPGVRPHVRLGTERRDGLVRLWVADNGLGIAPEHQARIFRVFERLHGVEAYPGTGIGLAIVAMGLERMGGRAGVDSVPGAGSRFWIELPEAEMPA